MSLFDFRIPRAYENVFLPILGVENFAPPPVNFAAGIHGHRYANVMARGVADDNRSQLGVWREVRGTMGHLMRDV